MRTLRRIWRDLLNRRHVEVHVVAGVSVLLAVLSLVGDVVGDELRWAAVLAALSLLTFQIAIPARTADLDEVLHNRAAFDEITFASRLQRAKAVWVFGPSAVNLLSADNMHHLRTQVLSQGDGVVQVVVLDPAQAEAMAFAGRQLDQDTDFPAVSISQALALTVDRLDAMAGWPTAGTFEYRFARFNPGVSLVAIDPYDKGGLVIVEVHGLHNESTASRMHIELTRAGSEHWFGYWRHQFEHLWFTSRRPDASWPD